MTASTRGLPLVVMAVLLAAAPAAAQPQDLAWVASQAPADACVVLTVRGVAELDAAVKQLAGPDADGLDLVKALADGLPPGACDTSGPMAVFVPPVGESLGLVLVLRVKDEAKLEGTAAGEGVVAVTFTRPAPPDAPPDFQAPARTVYVHRMGPWAAAGENAEAVKAVAGAASRRALSAEQRAAVGAHMVWADVNPKSLASAASKAMADVQKQAQAGGGPAMPAASRQVMDWLLGILDEVEDLAVVVDIRAEGAVAEADMRLAEGASLLAVAKAGLPLEDLAAAIPAPDRLVAAAWFRLDWTKAIPPFKKLVTPLLEILTKGEDEAARKSMKDLLDTYEKWGGVLGTDMAMVLTVAPPGQGMYGLVETFQVKDPGEYRKLMSSYMDTSREFMKVVMGKMSAMPGAPGMNVDLEYKEAAETIEGVAVDVMRMKMEMTPPPDAPPEARAQMKAVMEAMYGPDGMVFRMALVDRLAVVCVGDAGAMARAIRAARGEGPLLASDARVASAAARLKGGSVGAVLSASNYTYMAMRMVESMMEASSPPEVREAAKAEGLKPLEPPPPADLVTIGYRLDGRTARVRIDVPQADVRGAITAGKQGSERMMWYMKKQREAAKKQQPEASKAQKTGE